MCNPTATPIFALYDADRLIYSGFFPASGGQRQGAERLVGREPAQERQRHIVYGGVACRRPFWLSIVGMTMKNRGDAIPVNRLLQPARTEPGHDFRRFALAGGA